MRKKNFLFLTVAVVGVGFLGFSMGEELIQIPTGLFFVIPMFFWFVPMGWFWEDIKQSNPWGGLVALVLVLAVSYIAGRVDQGRAYDDCFRRGEKLRTALARYYVEHQSYPCNLNQLGWPDLPGKRLIGKNILEYEVQGSGYRMRFSSGPTTVIATETQPLDYIFMSR